LKSRVDDFIVRREPCRPEGCGALRKQATPGDSATKAQHAASASGNLLCYEALENLEVAIRDAQAVVTRDPFPTVQGDAVPLAQLLQKLIGNPTNGHRKDPPKIHVGAATQGREVEPSVSDNRTGIDPQNFKRLFVIFQRLHTELEYPRTGIGLAVCKKIAVRHGGPTWVESEPRVGSSPDVRLPKEGTGT
jgi:light-regulated signal transduction histidine kinase (bacteriophytochrome)